MASARADRDRDRSAPRGDRIQDRPLAEVGGKGLFTKEIEEALLAGRIDLAVHSAKDMPTVLPDGPDARGVPAARGPARCLHQPQGRNAARAAARRGRRHRVAAPAGAGQAAASRSRGRAVARQCRDAPAQARRRRGRRHPAGARRTEAARPRRRRHRSLLDVDEFLPAVGQGAIAHRGARRRRAHARAARRRSTIADAATALACERAFLAVLDGSCRTPIAGHATVRARRAARFAA